MGRIRQFIDVRGRPSWTLFDSGSRNTYIVPDFAAVLTPIPAEETIRTALGGSVHAITATAVLDAKIDGRPISTHAMVTDYIGQDDDGRPIDVLLGALAMQQWGIRLNPEQEAIDLTHYPNEFVEF